MRRSLVSIVFAVVVLLSTFESALGTDTYWQGPVVLGADWRLKYWDEGAEVKYFEGTIPNPEPTALSYLLLSGLVFLRRLRDPRNFWRSSDKAKP